MAPPQAPPREPEQGGKKNELGIPGGKNSKGGKAEKKKLLIGGAAAAGVVALALYARSKGTSTSATGTGQASDVLPVAYSNSSDDYDSLEAQIAQLQAVVARGQNPAPKPRKPHPIVGTRPAKHHKKPKPKRKARLNPGGLDHPPEPKRPRRKPRRPRKKQHRPQPHHNIPGVTHSHSAPPRPRPQPRRK